MNKFKVFLVTGLVFVSTALLAADPENSEPSKALSVPVVTFTPSDGATDVPRDAAIIVDFDILVEDEANGDVLSPTSVNAFITSFKINGGADVSFTAFASDDGTQITIIPDALLTAGTTYELDIAEVRDEDNNSDKVDPAPITFTVTNTLIWDNTPTFINPIVDVGFDLTHDLSGSGTVYWFVIDNDPGPINPGIKDLINGDHPVLGGGDLGANGNFASTGASGTESLSAPDFNDYFAYVTALKDGYYSIVYKSPTPINDVTPPTFLSATLASDNSYVEITFSEPVYNSGGSGAVHQSDFSVNFQANGGTATNVTISDIKQTDGSNPDGGEIVLRLLLNISGTPNGLETIVISPNTNSIFDGDGVSANPMPNTEMTSALALNDESPPVMVSAVAASDNTYIDVTFSKGVYGNSGNTNPVQTNDFNYDFTRNGGNATNVTVSSIRKDNSMVEGSATPLTGGETVLRFFLNLTGEPSGVETFEIDVSGGDVYGPGGSSVSTNENETVPLNDSYPIEILSTSDVEFVTITSYYVDITFDQGAYGAASQTGGIDASDFTINFTQGSGTLTGMTIQSVKAPDNTDETMASALTGGETVVRVFLSTPAIAPNGNETVALRAAANGIFDPNDNATIGSGSSESTGGLSLPDKIGPEFDTFTVDPGNTYIEITFSENVWTNVGTAGGISETDFMLSFNQNGGTATNVTLTDIKLTNNSDPTGGESTFRFMISVTGVPNGTEQVTITPVDGAAVFDNIDNAMLASESIGPITIQDNEPPSGYTVTWLQTEASSLNETTMSFQIDMAEVGSTLDYTVTDIDGPPNVSATGIPITTATQVIGPIDVSSLSDGQLTLNVTLTDNSPNMNTGPSASDLITKDTEGPVVQSITRQLPSPIIDTQVKFDVVFNEAVATGELTAADFTLYNPDNIIGPTPQVSLVQEITPSTFVVTVNNLNAANSDRISVHLEASGTASFNDALGNPYSTDFTSSEEYVVDNVKPLTQTFSPGQQALAVPITISNPDEMVLGFNENVAIGVGTIELIRTSDSFSVPISTAISNDELQINPIGNLDASTDYHILIPDGAVTDIAGNAFSGITDPTTWSFTTYGPAVITSVTPNACVGEEITILGSGFSRYPSGTSAVTQVEFCDGTGINCGTPVTAGGITFISDSEIRVTVPNNAISGQIKISKNAQNIVNLGTNPFTSTFSGLGILTNTGPTSAAMTLVDSPNACNEGSITTVTSNISISGGSNDYTLTFNDGVTDLQVPVNSNTNFEIDPPTDGDNNFTIVSVFDNQRGCFVPNANEIGDFDVKQWIRTTLDAGAIDDDVSGTAEIEILLSDYPTGEIDLGDNTPMEGVIPTVAGDETGVTWSVLNGPTSGGGSFDNTTALRPTYTLTLSDASFAGQFTLLITSDTPGGANVCEPVFDELDINFISDPKANPGSNQIFCLNDERADLNATLSGGANGVLWTRDATAPSSHPDTNNDGIIDNVLFTLDWGFTTDGGVTFSLTSNDPTPQYKPSPEEVLAGETYINAEPTINGTPQGGASQLILSINESPITTFTQFDEEVCLGEESVIYIVNNASKPSTYSWTAGPNVSFVSQGIGNAVIIDIESTDLDGGAVLAPTYVEVVETNTTDGCVGDAVRVNIDMYDLPQAEFNPKITYSNTSTDLEQLFLIEPGSNPADTIGLPEDVDQSVNFTGSGVLSIRENGVDNFYFDAFGLALGAHEVNWEYTNTYGQNDLECMSTGMETFQVFASENNIAGLEPEYCEDFGVTGALTPTNQSLVPIIEMYVLFRDKRVNNSELFGLVFDGADYTFNPATAAALIPKGEDEITFKVEFSFIQNFIVQTRSDEVTVFRNPNVDFEFSGPTTEGFTILSNEAQTQSIYIACDYDLPGRDPLDPIILLPENTVDDPANSITFVADLDLTNPDPNAPKIVSENVVTGNWEFHPANVITTGTDYDDYVEVEVTMTYSEAKPLVATCIREIKHTIRVYPEPPVPVLAELEPGLGNDKVCVTDSEKSAILLNWVTQDDPRSSQNAVVGWWDTEELIGENDQANKSGSIDGSDEFRPTLESLVSGVNDFWVAQSMQHRIGNREASCISQPFYFFFEKLDDFDFDLDTQCLDPDINNAVEFVGAPPLSATDARWDIFTEAGDPVPMAINNQNTVTHEFAEAGIYDVRYSITTVNGCPAPLTKTLVFNEQVTVTSKFNEDFQVSAGNWISVVEDESLTGKVWEWGSAKSGSTGINNNDNIWVTINNNGESYRLTQAQEEHSFLYSSCFDLSGLDKPMVAFEIFTETQPSDGVVLQFTTDKLINENTEWNGLEDDQNRTGGVVGKEGSGVNWYNSSGLPSRPGHQNINQYAWGGEVSEWLESKHELGELANAENVTFRFALASFQLPGGSTPRGIGINNFFIGDRTRTVLIENFSNDTQDFDVADENEEINDLMAVKNPNPDNPDIVLINYRTSFPNSLDALYRDNMGEAGARSQYYGIRDIPRSRLDGDEGAPDVWSAWGESAYGTRALDQANFFVELIPGDNVLVENGMIKVSPRLTAIDGQEYTLEENTVIHTVIVEAPIEENNEFQFDSGEEEVQFAMKKMLPSAAGLRLTGATTQTGNYEVGEMEWIPKNIYDHDNLYVITFVQDDSPDGSKEILQSGIAKLPAFDQIITSVDLGNLSEMIELYPNPSDKITLLQLPYIARGDHHIRVYDNFGKVIFEDRVSRGEQQLRINTTEFASGIYQIMIQSDTGSVVNKRMIVKH